jgi:hypothetical protein
MRRSFATASVLIAGVLACHNAALISRVPDGGGKPSSGDGGDGGGSGEGGTGGSKPPSGFGGFPDGGGGAGSGNPFGDIPMCAEDIHMAERVPLDLVLLVDRSMSMAGPKWDMTTKALTAFVSDARSAGLGVGLQFFPVSPVEHACKVNTDCGGLNSSCVERKVCIGTKWMGIPPSCGGPRDAACPAGTMCVPLGQCPLSSTYCTAFGKPCPDGPMTDLCTPIGKICQDADFSESCSADTYTNLNVRVGPLPLAQPALVAIIAATRPDGGTPMAAAVEGTLSVLQTYARANPTHRVVLILATDGVPSHCGTAANPENDIDMRLTAARMAMPSITTYTIGVFAPNEGMDGPNAVNRFAVAGGTGMGFVLDPNGDLTEKLLGALNAIRGAALPCEFTIPTPKSGMLDFDKVNVHFKGATADENVPYVGSAAKCDPVKGGWYYDVDPATAMPKKVVVCEKTCSRFKAEPTGKVQIGFGCKTIIIQ